MAIDTQLFYLLNNLAGQSAFFDELIVFLAAYLPYILIIVFLALVFFSQFQKREKLQVLLVTFGSSTIAYFGITETIRFFYHRPRVFTDLPVTQLLTSNEWSFPSGHATFFFAMATAIYLYNKKWGIGFFIAALGMGVSRVIAGIHYPSDIIGGALIGAAIASAIFYFTRAFRTIEDKI
ncbi:MAG: phosphatase PAP2 family protein [Candidatus Paceibacterota bacterium]|jgi:undecaprenyl-diphosphatase